MSRLGEEGQSGGPQVGAARPAGGRAAARTWIGPLLGVAALAVAFRQVPFGELRASLAGIRWGWIALAVLLQILAVAGRAERWLFLLPPGQRLSDAFWSQSIGYLFTNLLPLRAGELVRSLVMARRGGLSFVLVGTTVVMERLLDMGVVLLLLVLIVPAMPVPPVVVRSGALLGAGVLLGMLLLVGAARRRDGLGRLVARGAARFPSWLALGLQRVWQPLSRALVVLNRPARLLPAAWWTILSWFLSVALYAAVLRAFRPDARLVEAAFMVVALTIAFTVPSSPGYIGVFHLVGQQALVLPFGDKYGAAEALAITLVVHLIFYLNTSLLGALGLWRLGLSLGSLRAGSDLAGGGER